MQRSFNFVRMYTSLAVRHYCMHKAYRSIQSADISMGLLLFCQGPEDRAIVMHVLYCALNLLHPSITQGGLRRRYEPKKSIK